ncbi:hypothetical protein IAT40_004299 [Kwoniella sp. CBS 6097]
MPTPTRRTRSNATDDTGNKSTISREYGDDEADVTLVSSDGMKSKVHSYMLKAHSGFFRDMMTDATFAATPCDTDASSKHLQYFLDLIHLPDCSGPKNWDQVENVLKLCDKYDCWTVNVILDKQLSTFFEVCAWDIFCYASRRDDLELAKRAISNICHDLENAGIDISAIEGEERERVAPRYLVSLFHAINVAQQRLHRKAGRIECVDEKELKPFWDNVANGFRPRD